jgi:hypothetical protein
LEDAEIVGVVVRLDRPDQAVEGTATVFGIVEGQPRKIQITLSGADYDKAIQAHKDGSQVFCMGNLSKQGKSFVLKNPHGFTLVADI